MSEQNAKVGKIINPKEKFSGRKLISGFNIFSSIWWGKAISDTFKVLIIVGLILSLTFGIGYWRGMGKNPVRIGYRDFKISVIDKDGNRHRIEVKKHQLYFNKKVVRVKDVPKLKPYGIYIRPKLFAGVGNKELEVGLGTSVIYYFKFNLDVFGNEKTAYIGISRDIEFENFIDNSSIGIAIGKNWDDLLGRKGEDQRFLLYWSIKF